MLTTTQTTNIKALRFCDQLYTNGFCGNWENLICGAALTLVVTAKAGNPTHTITSMTFFSILRAQRRRRDGGSLANKSVDDDFLNFVSFRVDDGERANANQVVVVGAPATLWRRKEWIYCCLDDGLLFIKGTKWMEWTVTSFWDATRRLPVCVFYLYL